MDASWHRGTSNRSPNLARVQSEQSDFTRLQRAINSLTPISISAFSNEIVRDSHRIPVPSLITQRLNVVGKRIYISQAKDARPILSGIPYNLNDVPSTLKSISQTQELCRSKIPFTSLRLFRFGEWAKVVVCLIVERLRFLG
jgi:hypothetical protein